jgi:hypothetical protein
MKFIFRLIFIKGRSKHNAQIEIAQNTKEKRGTLNQRVIKCMEE